jgi:hypothetical protein
MSFRNQQSHLIVETPFSAVKTTGATCIWLDKYNLHKISPDRISKKDLEDLSSIVLPNPFFDQIKVSKETVTLNAEQYGGEGVGYNGGGKVWQLTKQQSSIKGHWCQSSSRFA